VARTTISDFVIWAKQIHDDENIGKRIAALHAGQTIDLVVDGVRGVWRKMDDGKDGRPTRGVRPLGRARVFWRTLYESRRGDVVTVELPVDETRAPQELAIVFPPLAQTEEERHAALQALLEAGRQGWRSKGRRMTRDEMHERE
jgi:hypothetical protein